MGESSMRNRPPEDTRSCGNIEWKSLNNTYLNIIIFSSFKNIEFRNLIRTSTYPSQDSSVCSINERKTGCFKWVIKLSVNMEQFIPKMEYIKSLNRLDLKTSPEKSLFSKIKLPKISPKKSPKSSLQASRNKPIL